jgi:hypothetical protein
MAINIGTLLIELGVNMGAFVEGMDKATYKAKQAGKEIGDAFKGIGKDVGGLLSNFGDVGRVIGDTFSQTGETLAKVAGQFGSLGGAAGAAAIGLAATAAAGIAAAAGMTALAISGAQLVHELELASAKTGIAVHDLQVLQAAGGTVGVSLEAMVAGFRKFDQALIGIGRGGGAAALTLKELGVTSRDNKDALYQVADAFAQMEDGPQKAAYAVQLFGRAGLNLIPLLDKGRQGLQEFENLVDEYGPKIGIQAKEANEAFLVSQTKLGLAFDNLKVRAEEAFLPTVTKIVTALADGTKAISDFDKQVQALLVNYVVSSDAFASAGKATQNKVLAGFGIGDDAGASKKKKEGDSPLLLEALRQRFDLIKAGGQAEFDVKRTEEEITELLHLGTAAAIRQASALESQLPSLRKAAEIEKQRNDYQLNPKPAALGADKEAEFEASLAERLTKQRELASATSTSTGADLLNAAAMDAQVSISKELRNYQGELVKVQNELTRVPSGTQQAADLLAKKAQLESFISTLRADTPKIVASYQEIAAATQINKANDSLDKAIDSLSLQNNELRQLAAAYDQGGEAIRKAQIEQQIAKQAQELNKAQIAYDALVASQGKYIADLSPEKTALDQANKKMSEARTIAEENANLKLDIKLKEEVAALNADAEAWNVSSAAVGMNTQARIAAAVQAARIKEAAKPGATSQEVDLAGAKAQQAEEQALATKIKEKAAQLDLNLQLQNELTVYNAILATASKESDVYLMAAEAKKKAIENNSKQWDQAAIDVGTFQQKAAGFLNELVQDGNNFWTNFGSAGLKAIGSVEDEFAKLITTGKGSFKAIGQTLEQGILKNSIQTVVSKGAGGLLSGLGLGGLIPGAEGKPDGSKTNPIYTMDASGLAGAALGGSESGGLGGLLGSGGLLGGALSKVGGFFSNIFSGIGNFFGGFLAGGGDVTPGKAYVVGEKHPEFFVPGKSGSVLPSLHTGGSHTTNMSVHFHGVTDADSFKKSQSQIAAMVHRQASRAYQRNG